MLFATDPAHNYGRRRFEASLLLLSIFSPCALLALASCQSAVYSTTGKVMSAYAVDHILPSMMQSDDVGMACETGVSMGSFLMSFERVADRPDKAALVTLMSAGMCAEGEAWEAELTQLRALRDSRASEAQDARIREKEAHYTAARRFHEAYQRLVSAYGDPTIQCPSLQPADEIIFLLGLSAGALAVLHDRAADGAAEVPLDLPRRVAHGAACLDEERWWGVPAALQAAVWVSIPGATPYGVDSWEVLVDAANGGDDDGVRLARAFLVQSAAAFGRTDEVRHAISDQARMLKEHPADPAWRMLDRYGTLMIQHESDKLWTSATGHRTPRGALGTFWDDPPAVSDDGLLDGLEVGGGA